MVKVYWSASNGNIGRVSLDGTGPEIVLTDLQSPKAIAIDVGAQKLYWANLHDISRADVAGTNLELPLVPGEEELGAVPAPGALGVGVTRGGHGRRDERRQQQSDGRPAGPGTRPLWNGRCTEQSRTAMRPRPRRCQTKPSNAQEKEP